MRSSRSVVPSANGAVATGTVYQTGAARGGVHRPVSRSSPPGGALPARGWQGDPVDFDLIAIGSGPAGTRAAIQAAKLRHRSAVIEQGRTVGGVCINTGTIPSKTVREAI